MFRRYLHENNVGASFSETNGHGLANATGAASDDGRLALKREHWRAHCENFPYIFRGDFGDSNGMSMMMFRVDEMRCATLKLDKVTLKQTPMLADPPAGAALRGRCQLLHLVITIQGPTIAYWSYPGVWACGVI